jgi:hypothetical protein
MSFITLIASLGLIAVASAKVTPKPAPSVTVYHKDLLQFNVSELFSYGQNVSCTSLSGSIARYTTKLSEISYKDISEYHFSNEPGIVQFVSNSTVFAVFDNSSIYIQPVNLDHESFGAPIVKSFGRPGAEAVCTDVAFNKNTNRIFVACFAKQSVLTPNSTLWVYEINGATGETVGSYNTKLDDTTQHIVHRANIMLVPIKRGANVELGAIVYDQGISSGLVNSNRWIWVLTGADSDTLGDMGVINFDSTMKLTSIYDMFPLGDGLLVTGKDSSLPGAIIKMASCQILLSGQASVTCISMLRVAPFNTSLGYAGIFNTGQYVEINADPNNKEYDLIHICNFQGNFGQSNFIDTKSCSSIPSFKIPDDVSISLVEGNIHQIVVQYVHFDSSYAGYSLHNFDLQYEKFEIYDTYAFHKVPLGKSLIKVNRTALAIYRMVDDYFFINADELKDGGNIIRVECSDSESTTPVANYISVTKLTSMTDGVFLNNDKIPDFSVYDGGRFMFQIDSDMVMGNDLSVSVSFDSKVANFTTAQVYDTELVNINWRATNTSVDFRDVHFSGRYAVTLDSRGWVSFHHCSFSEIAVIDCMEVASANYAGRNIVLKKDVNAVYGWLFAWATDSDVNITITMVFDGVHNTLNVAYRPGVASDCAMTESGDLAYQVCSYAETGLIRGYQYSQTNPQEFTVLTVINVGLSGRDYFCPIDVDFDPQVTNILEVLSVCPGKDQRILRYRYPPANNRRTGELEFLLISSIPLNFAYQNPQYCSMGTEFVVFSNINGKRGDLQSYNTVDDLNSWNFGTLLDDLKLGEIRNFNCVPRAGVFTTVSVDSDDPTKVSLAVYWGNNQYQANHKVFNTRREGLDQYKFIDSYEFMGQVIHTLYEPVTHTYDYMVSFTKGAIVDVRFEKGAVSAVDAKGKVGMEINVRNTGGFADTILKSVEIVSSNTSVKVSTKKKLTASTTGVIELEEFLEVKGPVADAVLKRNVKGVSLIGRLQRIAVYAPPPIDHVVFNNIQTVAQISVAVKTSDTNSSTFTIFHGIAEYVGQYSPAHGVNAYHFAPLASDPNSILIAYSTAEASNNTLQFVVLKGADRIGLGQSAFGQVLNFSMIRVIQLASATNDSFLVVGMNGHEHTIYHFLVAFANGRVTVTQLSTVDNVHDFGIAAPTASNSVFVIYNVQGEFNHVMIESFDKKTGQPAGVTKQPIRLGNEGLAADFINYQIVSLFAKEHNETAFYVVFNTASPYIFEYVYDTATNFQNPGNFRYMKMPGHEGRYMDGNKQNIVMLTMGDLPSGDAGARYIFYNRQVQANNGSTFPSWSFFSGPARPFSMTNCPRNNSHFQFAAPFDTAPILFFHVKPMKLNITDSSRLKDAIIEIDAAAHVQSAEISVADIISGDDDEGDKSSLNWWPFVLVIGVLILLAVGFIIYKAQKDKAMESDDPENYISLKPESKDARADKDDQ